MPTLSHYTTPLICLACCLGLLSSTHPFIAWPIIGIIILLLTLITLKKSPSTYPIVLLFTGTAFLMPHYLSYRTPHPTYYAPEKTPIITLKNLTIISDPTHTMIVKDPHNQRFILKVKYLKTPLHYADILNITGRLIEIKPPTNPGELDFRNKLKQSNISGIIFVTQLEKIGHAWENPFKTIAYFLRHRIHQTIRKSLPEPSATLYISLIFGDAGITLPEDIQDKFKKIGLTHLLVVSGAQVALLSGILSTLIQTKPLKKWLIITLANLIFLILTGGEASIVRAVIMNEIALILSLQKYKTNALQILSLTGLIMLLLNPHTLWDIGAHLSFLATSSLIFVAPILEEKFSKKLPEILRKSFSICLAPFLVTTPYLWIVFHTISPVSLLSNLIIMSWAEWIVVLGFFSSLIGLVCFPIAYIINQCSYALLIALTFCVATLEKIPDATFILKPPSLPSFSDHKLKVTYLDVGQGDAILIETPQKNNILIDTGPVQYDKISHQETQNMGKRIVVPTLIKKGISTINLMIITHQHADHIGGANYILSHLKVNSTLGYIKTNNYHYLRAPNCIYKEPNLTLTILYPLPNHKKDENENNNSLVTKLTYKNVSFLFTGDLEAEGEEKLVKTYTYQLKADVLKLGHHGSKTSSIPNLIAVVHPKIAIISAGKNNRYHHPSPSILYRMNQANIKTFRTDQNGAIEILTDGHTIRYKTTL